MPKVSRTDSSRSGRWGMSVMMSGGSGAGVDPADGLRGAAQCGQPLLGLLGGGPDRRRLDCDAQVRGPVIARHEHCDAHQPGEELLLVECVAVLAHARDLAFEP